jgi:hypothetical protein
VKLFELVKLMMEQTAGFHARALRVIGQDLAVLVPESVTIELQDQAFVAQGLCTKSRMQESGASSLTTLKKALGKMASAIVRPPMREPELEFVSFSRTYRSDDIDRLDTQATQQRGRADAMPDIYTLGERLRTIGKVIDARNGRIVKIFKDLHQVVFEYLDAEGRSCKEEMNNTELYQLQQRYAAERTGAEEPGASSSAPTK